MQLKGLVTHINMVHSGRLNVDILCGIRAIFLRINLAKVGAVMCGNVKSRYIKLEEMGRVTMEWLKSNGRWRVEKWTTTTTHYWN